MIYGELHDPSNSAHADDRLRPRCGRASLGRQDRRGKRKSINGFAGCDGPKGMRDASASRLLLLHGDESWAPDTHGLLIGREPPADILLVDQSVSRRPQWSSCAMRLCGLMT